MIDGTSFDERPVRLGPRPMEVFLVGAITCTLFDLVSGIKEITPDLHKCTANGIGKRSEKKPRVFTKIIVSFDIVADGITKNQIDQILKASKEFNGSAMKMLQGDAEIEFIFRLNE